MLVLTRHKEEEVYIYQEGDDVPLAKILICDVSYGKVRLGFSGDPDIVFHRREVAEGILADGRCPSQPMKILP